MVLNKFVAQSIIEKSCVGTVLAKYTVLHVNDQIYLVTAFSAKQFILTNYKLKFASLKKRLGKTCKRILKTL